MNKHELEKMEKQRSHFEGKWRNQPKNWAHHAKVCPESGAGLCTMAKGDTENSNGVRGNTIALVDTAAYNPEDETGGIDDNKLTAFFK